MWYYRGLKIRLSGIKLAFFSDMASIKNMFYNIKPKFPPYLLHQIADYGVRNEECTL